VRDLQGAWNFRDVADTTGVLRPGRLFRSGELSELGDEGRDELRRLGVTDVADLRSRSEVLRHGPGLVPDGVDIHLLPIPDLEPDEANPDGEAPHEHAFKRLLEDKADDEPVSDAAARYMVDEYSRFPTYNGAQQALHRVVSLLADGRTVSLGRILVKGNHTAEGKVALKGMKDPPKRALINYNHDVLASN